MRKFLGKLLIVQYLIICAALLSGCVVPIMTTHGTFTGGVEGTGEIISQTTAPGSFTGIDIGRAFSVTYRRSDTPSVTVVMHENLFEYLEISLQGGTLYIDTTEIIHARDRADTPRIYIYAPYLETVSLRGAVEASGWDTLYADQLSISLSGAVDLTLRLEVNNLQIHATGAVDAELSGKTDTADITAMGAANISAANMWAREVNLEALGASTAYIYAHESLDIRAAGAAIVRYSGDPGSVNSTVVGAGSVTPLTTGPVPRP